MRNARARSAELAARRGSAAPSDGWRPRLVEAAVAGGTAVIEPDPDRPQAAALFVDGTPQSHVDLGDPTYLCFEYVQHLGAILDTTLSERSRRPAVATRPASLLHLGGGALTLPRYVATTHPGSVHRVAEIDAALVELVRAELPINPRHRIRVSVIDGRVLVARTRASSVDALVVDVFAGARVPASLSTTEFFGLAGATLAPGGVLVMNLVDRKPLAFSRRVVASAQTAFRHTALSAEPSVWRGRRFGNLLVIASHDPLPVTELASLLARGPFPARLAHGADLQAFVAHAVPLSDATAERSPEPPADAFGLPRRAG